METKDIRLANMRVLISRYASAADFARKVLIDPKQIHLYQKGIRNIGPIVARRIERELGLAGGWMDTPQQSSAQISSAALQLHALLDRVAQIADSGLMSDSEIEMTETFLASMIRHKTSRGHVMSKQITSLQQEHADYESNPAKKHRATA